MDGTVYTAWAEGGSDWLGAFDAATGARKWALSLGDRYAGHDGSDDGPIATPVVATVAATALSVTKGEDGWVVEHVWTTQDFARSYVPAVRRDDRIFGCKGGFLYAIDAGSGETVWRSRPPGDGFLAVADDFLVVATKKGSLHLASATGTGWTELAGIDLFDDPDGTTPSGPTPSLPAATSSPAL